MMQSLARALLPLALVLAVPMSQAAHPDDLRTDPLGGTGGGPIQGSLQVRLVHDGTTDPFEGGFVMVGPFPGDPFPGNWGFTSAEGDIVFTDPALQGSVTVTAGAAGHRYFTLVSVDAADLVLPLRPVVSSDPIYEVGDYVSGIDVNNGPFHAGDGNIDMAFVVPSLRLSDLISFDMGSLLGPPEIVEILGQQFEVPSNFFIPQQWELFIEIIKDHYYVYLPAGDYTLGALSGRIPTDDLLGGGEIQDLLPDFQWREIDILDVSVAGDTYTADLYVDPDLSETVTLNLANIPDASAAFCISAGDLDNRAGLGRLIPLGLSSLDCPPGTGPCSGAVSLTTTAATGEFAGMTYFPVVTVDLTDTNDMLVLMDREPRTQTYTANMESFFNVLDLVYAEGTFSWNDVENPPSGSPDVDVQIARVGDTEGEAVYWELLIPGVELSFTVPSLPPEAPPGPVEGLAYTWEQLALGLGYDLPSFDFNDFAFSDILAHGTHVALDETDIAFGYPPAGIPEQEVARGCMLRGNLPNPFTTTTTIRYDLARSEAIVLSIHSVDGREVVTLAEGTMPAGNHQVDWSGRDAAGQPLPSGVYLVRLRLEEAAVSRRLLLLR